MLLNVPVLVKISFLTKSAKFLVAVDSDVLIDIRKKGKTHIEISIEDNGVGREKSALIKQKKLYKKDSVGINLTKERLSNFEKEYKNKYSLKFEDLYDENKNASGTKVIVRIPVK